MRFTTLYSTVHHTTIVRKNNTPPKNKRLTMKYLYYILILYTKGHMTKGTSNAIDRFNRSFISL